MRRPGVARERASARATPIQQPIRYPNTIFATIHHRRVRNVVRPFGKYGNESCAAFKPQSTNRIVSRHRSVTCGDARVRRPERPRASASNPSIAAADSTVVGIVGNFDQAMTLAALSRYANVGFAVVVPSVTANTITARGYHNIYPAARKRYQRRNALRFDRFGKQAWYLGVGRCARRRLRFGRRARIRSRRREESRRAEFAVSAKWFRSGSCSAQRLDRSPITSFSRKRRSNLAR